MPRTWLLSLAFLLVPSFAIQAGESPEPVESTFKKLTYPARRWSLVVDLPGYTFDERATREDLTGIRILGENARTGVILSIHMEKAERKGEAEACRAFYWSRAKREDPRPQEIRFSERKSMALVEYATVQSQGMEIRQDHVRAFMVHDGVWIDIHLSKDSRRALDRIVFDRVLDSVRIVEPGPEPPPQPVASSAAPPRGPHVFQAPGKEWGVSLEAPGAEFGMTPLYSFDRTDGEITGQRVTGMQWNGRMEQTGLVLWVALAKVDRDVDARGARDLIWEALKRGQAGRMTGIAVSDRGDLPIVEYMLPLVDGRKADIKNTLAFLGRDGIAGIVQVSKVDYRPEDARAFQAVLESIRIAELPATPP